MSETNIQLIDQSVAQVSSGESTTPASSLNASAIRPILVASTQQNNVPVAQLGNRVAVQIGVNQSLRPVRLLQSASTVRLAATSINMQTSSVPLAMGAQGNLSVVQGASDNSGKTQFVLCQVSGGRTVLVPQSLVSGLRLSTATSISTQQPAGRVVASGQAGSNIVQVSSGVNTTMQMQVIRAPISVQSAKPTVIRPAPASGAQLQLVRAVTPGSNVTINSQIQIVQLSPSLVANQNSTMSANKTTVLNISSSTPTNSVRLLSQPTRLRLISPVGGATSSGGLILKQSQGQRLAIAGIQGTSTITGSSVGASGIRLISIRGSTPLSVVGSSSQVGTSNPVVSQVRILTQGSTGSNQLVASATVGKLPLSVASASLSTGVSSSTSIAMAGTPLVLQSGSATVKSAAAAGQLANILKTSTGLSAGKTFYMITNTSGGNQTLNAALVRAKSTAGVAVSTSSGLPRIITIPNMGTGGVQAMRSVTLPALRAPAGSTAIVVDARKGGNSLSKAEQHQSKADRIVAEAIAKAHAEGINVDSVVGGSGEVDKRRRRKKNVDADFCEGDLDSGLPSKRKRLPKPRTPGPTKRGSKYVEPFEEVILDMNAEGLAISEECEVATAKTYDSSDYGNLKSMSRFKSKKRKPLATFLKNKKRKRRKDSESDMSESEMTPGGSIDEETLRLLQTRRSGRVLKRKKYTDDLDLNLSEEDNSQDEDSSIAVDGDSYINGITLDQPAEFFVDNPAEEDAQLVEKILAMRVVKRKVINQRIESADDNLDVDIEGEDRNCLRKMSSGGIVEEIDVEEFFVKYKNYSYLHCEWRTADELLIGDKRVLSKIKRFKIKRMQSNVYLEVDEDEPFNPDYVEVDRVLDVAVTPDSATGEDVTHYLVLWRSLPYEDSTWELEQDVDQDKIDFFNRFRKLPPKEERQYKARPYPANWSSIEDSRVYKNGNVLRDYQLEGLNWLTFSYYNRQNCILADEMGLGKTIQSISFLNNVFEYGIRGPFLVIVPLSTLGHWQREFEAWTDLNAIVYHGSAASRNMLKEYEMYYKDDRGNRIDGIYKFHALITTYEVIITDLEELSQIDWRVAVIDEAHRLKNRNCKLLQGLTCFELEHRVLLTGTPLQNNVDELFSLLSFLEPRQFSSSEQFIAEFGRLETESQVDKLKALLKPMMLRRLKEDVEKTLASKEETIVEVELTNIQKKYYRAILERNFSFLAKGGSSANLPNLMNTMMELRKCCNHPYLVNGAEEQILEEFKGNNGGCPLDSEKLFQMLVQSSGKLVLVDKLLPKLNADGHKVLIFSQMIRVLDIIEDYLIHKHYLYERIDGRIRGNLRQEAIDRFSKPDSDRFVFLLCTRAGGLGINLTAADTVIIFDSDWNPQNDVQAQARCHRIGQLKAVKVYRLITRNTYEREMFDKASLKLGLDKAVLQSSGSKEVTVQNQLSKKEIEDLLKKGAYGALMDDDNAGEEFCEEDIEHILRQRTQVIKLAGGTKGSTFAKASFNLSGNRSDINIDDPNFWQKWAKKADIDVNGSKKSELIMELPRQRKVTKRYGRQDNVVDMSDLDSSNSEEDGDESGGKGGRKRKKRGRGGRGDDDLHRGSITYTRSECFKVEKNLLVYGWGRWDDIMQHAFFKRKLRIDDIITITRAMLLFSLRHYEGDDRIKKFILDLISPSEDGKERDYKNHSGLSAPVPRGRKGRKIKKDTMRKAQFEEDLSKLDIDVNKILIDEGYKKHLVRQSNKVLLRVRLLYYLKQEVIGRQAEKIFSGASPSEIDVPVLCADVDMPIYWWDAEADKCLLVGVFKHGYEKYNQIRQDPCLCFLSRCGPPDNKALLAEQNDDEDMKELEDEDEEPVPRRRGRGRKKKKKKSKLSKNFDVIEDNDSNSAHSSLPGSSQSVAENGKLPFPTASDLNTRFRRVITSFQRCHKQGMLKLEQISKKMHKREQLMDREQGSDVEDSSPRSPSRLPSLGFEGINSNPLLLAEQLHWTRREESDFYRIVSTFGVERDPENGQFIWDKFRMLAKLERKLDNMLTEYFRAFYHMCMKVCCRFSSDDEARPPNGLIVLPITEERANRCLARIDLLNKIREQILWHPFLETRLALCQPNSYMPAWWVCGQHDKELLVGAARHGVSHTEMNILNDPALSFNVAYQQYQERMAKEMKDMVPEDQTTSHVAADSNNLSDDNSSMLTEMKQELKETVESVKPVKLEEKKPGKTAADSCSELGVTCKSDVDESNDKDSVALNSKDSFKLEDSVRDDEEAMDNDEMATEGKPAAQYWNYQWPKDRIIFYRLEHICHCIETARWRMSHRHHQNLLNETASHAVTPSSSVPGTPLVGCQDYAIVPNADEVGDGLKVTLHKRRHRRTKAEMEAERRHKWRDMSGDLDGSLTSGATGGDDSCTGEFPSAEGVETPTFHKRKQHVRRPKYTDDDRTGVIDPDSRVPVMSLDGQHMLSGNDAPALRDLEAWLEDHPHYAPVGDPAPSNQRSVHRRRPRLDPTKLSLDQLTGTENVTVVNRNTGKRITGSKAPILRDLHGWLIRNPGFDVDAKWAYVVHQTMNLPEELRQRIMSPSEGSGFNKLSSTTPMVDPSHNYGQPADIVSRSADYRSSKSGYLTQQRWSSYPEDMKEDDDDEDTNSDHEMMSRQSSNKLVTSSQSASYDSSRPYLCSSSVVDRMCTNIGSSSGQYSALRLPTELSSGSEVSPSSYATANYSSMHPMFEEGICDVETIVDIALEQSYPDDDDET